MTPEEVKETFANLLKETRDLQIKIQEAYQLAGNCTAKPRRVLENRTQALISLDNLESALIRSKTFIRVDDGEAVAEIAHSIYESINEERDRT
jgi:hypothetical protein